MQKIWITIKKQCNHSMLYQKYYMFVLSSSLVTDKTCPVALTAPHAACSAHALDSEATALMKNNNNLYSSAGKRNGFVKLNTPGLITVLIPAQPLLFLLQLYKSMVPSPWTWPVKAGMLVETSSSSPTLTRTTRKSGPGKVLGIRWPVL